MNEQDAVFATLEEYATAYCAKDADRLMRLFDDGDDVSLIGTGSDELCVGRSAIKDIFIRNFSEATATRFDWDWWHVTVTDGCAVVAVTLTIHLDAEAGPIEVRWTVSMIRRRDTWRWLHRHASAAATSQKEGTAYPVRR